MRNTSLRVAIPETGERIVANRLAAQEILEGTSSGAGNAVLSDGSVPLTADWDIGDGRAIEADEIRARDSAGLLLRDDSSTLGVCVEDGGQVGIGTSSPVRSLHVGGGGQSPTNLGDGLYVNPDGNSIQITAENNLGDEGGILVHSDGITYIGSISNDKMALITNNTTRVTVATDGKVGIGTSSPARLLHVGGGSQSPTNTMDGIYCNPNANTAQITAENSNGVEGGMNPHSDSIFYMGTWSSHSLALTAGNTARAYITTAGRLGVGTSSPTALLDVNSDVIRLRTAKTPASASATGNQGDLAWDSSYIYICTATNTWRRIAHATW